MRWSNDSFSISEKVKIDKLFLNFHNFINKEVKYIYSHSEDNKKYIHYELLVNQNAYLRLEAKKITYNSLKDYLNKMEDNTPNDIKRDLIKNKNSYRLMPDYDDMSKAKNLFPFREIQLNSMIFLKNKKYRGLWTNLAFERFWLLYDIKKKEGFLGNYKDWDFENWDKDLKKEFDNIIGNNFIKKTIKFFNKINPSQFENTRIK